MSEYIFLLERGHRHTHTLTKSQTPLISLPTARLTQSWVSNFLSIVVLKLFNRFYFELFEK